MNDPQVAQFMTKVREWVAQPLAQAKANIVTYMKAEDVYSPLDFAFVDLSESVEEAIGLVFGV